MPELDTWVFIIPGDQLKTDYEKPLLTSTMRLQWKGFSAATCYWTTKVVSGPRVHFDLR
jgi:hypothetical protein